MVMVNEGSWLIPGITAKQESIDNDIYWARFQDVRMQNRVIIGTARDAGNSTVTLLRAGLLLGEITASKKLKEWNPTATDGSETVFGVLLADVNTQRLGSNQDRFLGFIMVGGPVKVERIIIPGQASAGISGNALEYLLLNQMLSRFNFNSLRPEPYTNYGSFKANIAKTANFTVLETQNGTLFTNKGAGGAVTFTTPATAKKGLHYGFFAAADQNVIVTGGTADTLIVFNDAAADSIALQTGGEILGSMIEIFGDGALWMVKVSLAADSVTVTIVT